MDHAFLRVWWTNFAQVAPGVYRSNQPAPKRMRRYHQLGIKAILNLRGDTPMSYYLFEKESADRYGIAMVDMRLGARSLPRPDELLQLKTVFETIPRPFLMHCKSGADRAGFVAALYLMMIEGAPVEVAAKQLHWRFAHLKSTKTGVLDHFLRFYARERDRTGVALLDWIRDGYDPQEVTESFHQWQKGNWPPKG